MPDQHRPPCPDCDGLTRRDFIRTVGGAAVVAAAGSLPLFATPIARAAAPEPGGAETLVKTLYDSLTEKQRSVICKAWSDPLRSKVDNNWNITPMQIKTFTPDQQEMIRQIFRQVHTEEYYPKVLRQLMDDAGGIDNYTIAIFGTPGSGKFEWVLTGRHMTIRCDGDSVDGTAFGGPIFYGHAAHGFNEPADHPGNVYWYQALRANEVFRALDGRQRAKALLDNGPPEQGNATVAIKAHRELPGVHVSELSRDQKQLVARVMEDLLAPFRKADADEAMKYIKANGGLDSLSLAFYKNEDIGMDGVWDVWRMEGPAMVWYFRGAPHVHTWVNVAAHPEG
jgi:hypothetical protein